MNSATQQNATTAKASPSPLVLGLMRVVDAGVSGPALAALLRHALSLGVNTLDSADIYGGGEVDVRLGEALRHDPGLRPQLHLIGKCGIALKHGAWPTHRVKHYETRASHIQDAVGQMLRQWGTDRVDTLLIHRPDPLMDFAEVGHTLDALVASGDVGQVGVSNFMPHDMAALQSHMSARLCIHQIELSLAHTAPFVNGQLAHHQQHRVTTQAWSPMGGLPWLHNPVLDDVMKRCANTYGVTHAQLALAFLAHHPSGIVPVVGSTQPGRLTSAVEAMAVTLDRQDWFALYEAARGREVD